MLVLIHVIIASLSIGQTTYVFIKPSAQKLKAAYGLVAMTLFSGTYLVISTGSPILQSCVTGLTYIGIISVGLVATHRKLVRATIVRRKTD